MTFLVTMDFFQHRYYKINRVLMTTIGLWPYQTTSRRVGSLALIIIFGISQFIPQVLAIAKNIEDWEFLLKCSLSLLYENSIVMKLIYSVWNTQRMITLLNRIRTDWQVWAQDREINILHEYAEQGRKRTVTYAVLGYSAGILYTTQPIIHKIIDVLMMNGSEPGEFPYPVDYYHLDMQKYYFYIATLTVVCGACGWTIQVANDAMFIVCVQHGCGIFAALGHKLERIGHKERSAERGKIAYAPDKKDMDFEKLVTCVDRHNDAIEYAVLIEETYSWCFFFLVGFDMLAISITGFQIVQKTNDPPEFARYIAWLIYDIVHLYIASYMSQLLIDHSISIRYYIHNSKWYRLSLKSQKLLLFMESRCSIPCTLTAGKIFIMSLENFRVFMKTSMSYFTLLRSI